MMMKIRLKPITSTNIEGAVRQVIDSYVLNSSLIHAIRRDYNNIYIQHQLRNLGAYNGMATLGAGALPISGIQLNCAVVKDGTYIIPR